MTPDFIFYIILCIVMLNFLFSKILTILNMRHLSPQMPQIAAEIFTPEQYANARSYILTKQTFGIIVSSLSFLVLIALLLFDGFALLDGFVRSLSNNQIIQALLFFGILGLAADVASIPFDLYSTFKIEAKYGFNKSTLSIFFTDKLKSWMLGLVIGGGLLSLIVWFYLAAGHWFVPVTLMVMVGFSVFMNMFYTSLIVPIFNKLKPLPDGNLKEAIEDFAKKAGFPLSDISVIDSSKRSTKSNAYFSGLGRKKRIVLFDTLIEKHTTDELVAVLAHEIGHYKLKHIRQGLIIGIFQTSVLLFMLYFFLDIPLFQQALGVKQTSFHMGVVVFGLLLTPVSLLMGLIENYLSRRNEYAADAFAAKFGMSEALMNALKKLTSDNFSNPTPHPLYVKFYYSHPPLSIRLAALRKLQENADNSNFSYSNSNNINKVI